MGATGDASLLGKGPHRLGNQGIDRAALLARQGLEGLPQGVSAFEGVLAVARRRPRRGVARGLVERRPVQGLSRARGAGEQLAQQGEAAAVVTGGEVARDRHRVVGVELGAGVKGDDLRVDVLRRDRRRRGEGLREQAAERLVVDRPMRHHHGITILNQIRIEFISIDTKHSPEGISQLDHQRGAEGLG
jgi:hypothetical protein